jgi:hypothetical protein
MQPLDERTRAFAIGAGLILIGCGVLFLVKTIEAHVWEGESILGQLGLIYCSIYCSIYLGLAILGMVIRDYRLVHYGTSSRQLTAAQIEPIRRALEEDYDLPAAIKRYREAAPEAGSAEAKQYVICLFNSLRAQHPDKFVPPSLSLATLNWNAMGICALIEAVSLGVLWYAMRPSLPDIAEFPGSFLFGMGMIAGTRVKAFRKKMLLMAPGISVILLSYLLRLPEVSFHSSGMFVNALLCGSILMLSGFRSLRSLRRQTPLKP